MLLLTLTAATPVTPCSELPEDAAATCRALLTRQLSVNEPAWRALVQVAAENENTRSTAWARLLVFEFGHSGDLSVPMYRQAFSRLAQTECYAIHPTENARVLLTVTEGHAEELNPDLGAPAYQAYLERCGDAPSRSRGFARLILRRVQLGMATDEATLSRLRIQATAAGRDGALSRWALTRALDLADRFAEAQTAAEQLLRQTEDDPSLHSAAETQVQEMRKLAIDLPAALSALQHGQRMAACGALSGIHGFFAWHHHRELQAQIATLVQRHCQSLR